jgi:SAM-dependent methyltransferase
MVFTLDKVVPWGRSFDEYVAMFAMTESNLGKSILGCGDGPAGFNADLAARGGHVVSVDPIYRFSTEEIRGRIDATFETVLEQTRLNPGEFVWDSIRSVEQLGEVRMRAMRRFLEDYPNGHGRYVVGELPTLPFADNEFDFALCSHFLFLYSEHLDFEFHRLAIRELCRVATEARIFPILELGAVRSRHIDRIVTTLNAEGYDAEIMRVPYEFSTGRERNASGKARVKIFSSRNIEQGANAKENY